MRRPRRVERATGIGTTLFVYEDPHWCQWKTVISTMGPENNRNRGFLLADGSVAGCFITPENSEIRESYIIIVCKDGANPNFNRLQLRTDPPTFIELQPGSNILMIEDYPALKYGFKQLDNYILEDEASNEYNGGDIISVDFSYFDSSEVTHMNNMFERMEYLRKINFGSVKFDNITHIEHAFDWVNAGLGALDGDLLDLSGIDFSKILDTSEMLNGCGFETVNLTCCDMSNVKNAYNMFNNCGIRKLILDDAKLSNAVIEAITTEAEEWASLEEVSLIGCDIDSVKSIISGLTIDRPETWHVIKFHYRN